MAYTTGPPEVIVNAENPSGAAIHLKVNANGYLQCEIAGASLTLDGSELQIQGGTADNGVVTSIAPVYVGGIVRLTDATFADGDASGLTTNYNGQLVVQDKTAEGSLTTIAGAVNTARVVVSDVTLDGCVSSNVLVTADATADGHLSTIAGAVSSAVVVTADATADGHLLTIATAVQSNVVSVADATLATRLDQAFVVADITLDECVSSKVVVVADATADARLLTIATAVQGNVISVADATADGYLETIATAVQANVISVADATADGYLETIATAVQANVVSVADATSAGHLCTIATAVQSNVLSVADATIATRLDGELVVADNTVDGCVSDKVLVVADATADGHLATLAGAVSSAVVVTADATLAECINTKRVVVSDTTLDACVDTSVNLLGVCDGFQHAINQSGAYVVADFSDDCDTAEPLNYIVECPAGVTPHWAYDISAQGGAGTIAVYKHPYIAPDGVTAGKGVEVASSNLDFTSLAAADVKVYRYATILADGTLAWSETFGSSIPQSRFGGIAALGDRVILAGATSILVRYTALTDDEDVFVNFTWCEE